MTFKESIEMCSNECVSNEICKHNEECYADVCFSSEQIKVVNKLLANERAKTIEEIHKTLVEEIKSNPNVIYIDNQDYCCVARGSVLRVIRDTLEYMKEGAEE